MFWHITATIVNQSDASEVSCWTQLFAVCLCCNLCSQWSKIGYLVFRYPYPSPLWTVWCWDGDHIQDVKGRNTGRYWRPGNRNCWLELRITSRRLCWQNYWIYESKERYKGYCPDISGATVRWHIHSEKLRRAWDSLVFCFCKTQDTSVSSIMYRIHRIKTGSRNSDMQQKHFI